jgi:hypothetical protein
MDEFTTEPEEAVDLSGLTEDVKAYIDKLQTDKMHYQQALSARIGAESRGIAWCDMFGVKVTETGQRKVIKISLTSRSDVGPQHALDNLISVIKEAQDKYHLTPYQP